MSSSRLLALILITACGTAHATELVYVPVNPAFGGSPLNGSWLLSSAQTQNRHKEPTTATTTQSALQKFKDSLQSAILGRVATGVSSSIVGSNGQLIPGTIETSDFRITISSLAEGVLEITTTDKATGQTTQFQVSQP